MIAADSVSFLYPGGSPALSGLSFSIKRGEFAAVLGANGAGKTTLLKTMVGLLSPYEGDLKLAGLKVSPANLRKLYKKVGYVFQNSDDQLFMPTVFDDVAYGPRNLGLPADRVRELVVESLESVGMAELAGQAIHALSAGEKKRTALAGVLAMKAEVMLLDEPTAGLDPAGVHQVMKLLKHLNKTQGLTVLMATHNVNLLPTFMDQALIMNRGKIVCQGTPSRIFESGLLGEAGLRLPEIAQLMKELELNGDRLPLTVYEAREALKGRLKKL
ncbi:MAG: energy-coupling factor ABC transporter ATP-binding protein [bacterium]